MADNYFNDSVITPSSEFAAISPSDSTYLTEIPKSLYVGTGGNLVAINAVGDAITFTNVPSGSVLPIRPKRVNATSTTATGIVGIY